MMRKERNRVGLPLVILGLAVTLVTCNPKATPAAEATPTPILRLPTPTPTEHAFNIPPISHPLTATLGSQIELLGYDLSTEVIARPWYNARRESSGLPTFTLTLYWRALTEMDEGYTVFARLLAPDGSLTGQRDNPPVRGAYPTNLWRVGEVVTDVYKIPVRLDAMPTAHRLEVGMYVAETTTRLLVAGTAEDTVFLQAITVTQ